jgi:hypothetical protein
LHLGSFCRVDLCHQPDDDDDYEGSFSEEPLLGKTSNELIILTNRDRHRKCFPIRFSRIGHRQKIVTMVWETKRAYFHAALIFVLSLYP